MIVITVQYTKKERVQKNTFPKNKIAYPAERKYFFASFPSNLLVRSINNAILKGNKCWIEISVFHTYINLQSNLSIKFSKLFVQILKKICSSSQKYLIKFSKRFGQILNNICAWIWEQFWARGWSGNINILTSIWAPAGTHANKNMNVICLFFKSRVFFRILLEKAGTGFSVKLSNENINE